MDLFGVVNLDQLSHGLAGLSMFPYFDTAHYIVSVMALREQPGVLEVARRSPFACWFSSMLYCFGGGILSALMMAEAPIAPLSKNINVLMASVIWYLVFYCPQDVVYSCIVLFPLRLVLTGMKEVTRTWKVLGGVAQAHSKYKDGLLVMIAIGWAEGAGGGLISNFEQLVRGVWKPETNELLKMTYPTKVTLIGAVLFALQQTQYLPIQKHHLMLLYTVFTVVNKTNMMLTGSSSSPFAPIESVVHRTFFAWPSPSTCTIFTSETKTPVVKKPSTDSSLTTKKGTGESLSGAAVPETSKTPWSPSKTAAHNRGKASQKKAKEQPENTETESCKKSD
ncbi:trimeric intracellular cation channel type B [Coregonus clupeaformis]|uniref:trimeric intracellular cation channel type B n=1 Tax=Coregonus clupeaformis TaxID=59861 RepID=UPI001BDFDDF2|nr:trimeric intracellular cation channel type B [Coregonus clupeaformis]